MSDTKPNPSLPLRHVQYGASWVIKDASGDILAVRPSEDDAETCIRNLTLLINESSERG